MVTVIVCVVSPVDQVFPVDTEDVNTTEPPSQNVVGPPALTVGAGGIGFTVMVIGALDGEVQPNCVSVTE